LRLDKPGLHNEFAAYIFRGHRMKKIYAKPLLVKRERLSNVVASVPNSGIIIIEEPTTPE
jgi:hypothetical protein